MENFQKIAVLIDADNTQLTKLEAVLHEVSTYGRIVVKKAYGNWRKDSLKNWESELKRLAIRAEQQFDYVTGKNTTDIAMVIGAMDLLVKTGLVKSKSEARRTIQQGGLTINDTKVTDVYAAYGADAFAGDGMIIRKGKKSFRKVTL